MKATLYPHSLLNNFLQTNKVIVICGREDDARSWMDALGASRCLAIALDAVPTQALSSPLSGASSHLAWQHDVIAGLDGSGWLARHADEFDSEGTALLIFPDPLDPSDAGTRRRIGRRNPAWRLFEDKTVVDVLWDLLDVPRARTIVADGSVELSSLGRLVDMGAGVVLCCQPTRATPVAGADNIWWCRGGNTFPASASAETCRVRLMPLLEGLPVRLHGLVLGGCAIPFPPLEIVTLPRLDRRSFLCAGAVPSLGDAAELRCQTERIGTALGKRLGYRGCFSVDGIVTTGGFLPTDFNARLTSAMEAAPPESRIRLHAANLLAREGINPEPAEIEQLASEIFTSGKVLTLYGSAARVRTGSERQVKVCWDGGSLVTARGQQVDGILMVTPSVRGFLLTAMLAAASLPTAGPIGILAPEVFRFSDRVLGTDFGEIVAPFGVV